MDPDYFIHEDARLTAP
jgi:PPOX class probable FMN-dependent enzyme